MLKKLFLALFSFFKNYLLLFTKAFQIRKYGFRPLLKLIWQTVLILVGLFFLMVAIYSKDLPTPGKIQKRIAVQSTQILDRNGNLLYAVHGEENRIILKGNEIPDLVKKVTISVEDKNFYHHFGVDFKAIVRAFLYNITHRGKRPQGGSTLTQQFVKNALLSPKRTLSRKIKEAILAVELEIMYSKDTILTMYLNEIPYGSNAYGIEAAAKTYFGKKTSELNLAEIATLVALPRAPTYYSPYGTHTEELFQRKDYVLDQMVKEKYVTKDEAEKTKGEKITFIPRRESIIAPHFVMWVKELLADKYGEKIVSTRGLKVTTTLDLEKQKIAQEVIDEWGPKNLKRAGAKNAALVSLDPKTGQILAMVGSRDYFDTSIDGNVNVALALRQPGSAFKPIVYATAFKDEWAPSSVLFDLPTDFGGGYTPSNYDGNSRGPVTIRTALANSLNVPAVKMLALVGLNNALKTASDFGITTLNQPSRYGLSLVLGGGEIKLLELTSAYSIFANQGIKNEISPFLKIEDQKGKILEKWEELKSKKEVIVPEIAYEISSILSDNEARAPIFGSRSSLYIPGRIVAAKTGTTDAFRDAWTLGYTPSLVTGVWVGNNDNASMSGTRGAGAMAAAPIWHDFMVKALGNSEKEEFQRPSSIQEVTVDALTGKLPLEGLSIRKDIFASWQVPKERAFSKGTAKICKISGKLATDLCPSQDVEEKTFVVIHSEKPDDPNWEAPVRAWAEQNGFLTSLPTEYCDVHTEIKKPTIKISSPKNNETQSDLISIQTEVNAPNGVEKVEFFIDNISIGSKTEAPYSTSYEAKNLSTGSHTLQAILYDKAGLKAEDKINITVEKKVTTPVSDTTPPSISDVTVSNITSNSATISWKTQEAATSQIKYGIAQGNYLYQTQEDNNLTLSHSIILSSLSSLTTYYFKVFSKDASGNLTESSESNFQTKK